MPKFHGQGKLDLKDVAGVCAKTRGQNFVISLCGGDIGSIFSSYEVERNGYHLLPPASYKYLHE